LFFELTSKMTKSNLVVTFLALLELVRSSEIFVSQDDLNEDIIISPNLNLN